jgi:hypothetical protein
MKKLSRIAALLAAGALLFGFASCSDGGGSDDKAPSNPVDDSYTGPATEDSWDFTTYGDLAWVNPEAAGSVVVKDSAKYSQDGTYTISADASVKGASDVLTLTVAATGTGKGTSVKDTNYSYQSGTTDGLRFKNDAFKIAGVKGKVKLTIEWSCIAGKAAGDRNLEVTVGSGSTKSIGNDATTSDPSGNVAMTPYTETISAGSGSDIYIGASNNIFIKTITLEDASDAVEKTVSVVVPSFDTGLTGAVTKTYSIGYDDSITADGLTAKLKADTTLASALEALVAMIQTSIDEVLTDAGLSAGAVTVTSDHVALYYFASEADWTAFDNADDEEAEAAAIANALDTIDGDATVYINFGTTAALNSAVENAIINATASWEDYDTITLTGTAVTSLSTSNAIKYVKKEDSSSGTKVTTYPRTAATAITSDYTVLADDASVSGTNVTLTLKNYTGTGVGITKTGTSAAMPTVDDEDISAAPVAIAYKADSTKGLMIKKDALKFALPAGTYNIVINFYQNSTSARNLEVTYGDAGATESFAAGTTKQDVKYEKETITFDSDTNVYIGASNELYIKSIVIKKAE